jgi:hypothetical protein
VDYAIQLQDGNVMLAQNGVQDRAPSKFLETQHWLELVDGCVERRGGAVRAHFAGAGSTAMDLTVESYLPVRTVHDTLTLAT